MRIHLKTEDFENLDDVNSSSKTPASMTIYLTLVFIPLLLHSFKHVLHKYNMTLGGGCIGS